MESNTDRMERVLVLWLELHRAMRRDLAAQARQDRPEAQPWESQDHHVKEIWLRLTAPANGALLEQWLQQSAEGRQADWAREALKACRKRLEEESPPN